MASLWDILLWEKPIRFEVDMPPQELRSRLLALSHPNRGFFNAVRREVLLGDGDEQYTFDIQIKGHGRGVAITSAHAFGRVTLNQANGRSLVIGAIWLGQLYVLVLAGAILFAGLTVIVDLRAGLSGYLVALILCLWMIAQLRADYLTLRNVLYTALMPEASVP